MASKAGVSEAALSATSYPLKGETCRTVLPDSAYVDDFDVFWTFVRDTYAYWDEKKTDWDAVRTRLRPQVARAQSDADLISILEDALSELYDSHAHLGVNTSSSPRLIPSGTDLWAEWDEGQAVITAVRAQSAAAKQGITPGMVVRSIGGEPVDDAVSKWMPRSLTTPDSTARDWALRAALAGRHGDPVALRLARNGTERRVQFQPEHLQTPDGPIGARLLPDSIGYIRLENSLGHMQTLTAFDSTLGALRETRGLILDLRNTPGGGNTTVARGIMGRFISEAQPYQRHDLPAEMREYGIRRLWAEYVGPRGPFSYDAPLVVLVGRWTGSMGEGLAIGLDGIGRATVIGTPMARLRGALYEHILPHTGIPVRIPAERLFHVDGTPRENFIPLPLSAISSPPTSPEGLATGVPVPALRAAHWFIQQNTMGRK